MAVDDPAQKAEPFPYVAAIVPNVVLGDVPVDCQEIGHAGGPGKKIGGMAELRSLHNYGFLKVEDVFGPKQIKVTSTLAELLVVEGVIIWLPRDLRDVEIAGNEIGRASCRERV